MHSPFESGVWFGPGARGRGVTGRRATAESAKKTQGGLLSPALWGYPLPGGQNTFPAPRRPVPAGDCLLSPREVKKSGVSEKQSGEGKEA